MLFNSFSFLFLFLPLFLLTWEAVARLRPLRLIHVPLFASLAFYALWSGAHVVLLGATIAINYAIAQFMLWHRQEFSQAQDQLRHILFLAILINLLPLLWFKYSWFIIQNVSLLFQLSGSFMPPDLPLGISFYTFIQLAWLVAIYKGEAVPGPFPEHMVFSCAFPYVISGPIVRAQQMDWQLLNLRPLSSSNLARGLTLFVMGLAKKVILADSMGPYANAVFNAAQKNWPLSGAEAWLGSFCYTYQLYFDFSGYTDMALGLGLMVGLRLPENFNSPYKSTGIVDFWRRWHITLSSWLRDFLYIPLGGNRHGRLRQYRNLFLTMLIGGAWHGAGWTFLIWGAMHGFMLCANHFFRGCVKNSCQRLATPLARVPSIIFTFLCLNFCWVIFRAPDLYTALAMYKTMFADFSMSCPNGYFPHWEPFALLILCASLCWFCPNSQQILEGKGKFLGWRPTRCWAAALALLAFVSMALLSRQSSFLYFQF